MVKPEEMHPKPIPIKILGIFRQCNVSFGHIVENMISFARIHIFPISWRSYFASAPTSTKDIYQDPFCILPMRFV